MITYENIVLRDAEQAIRIYNEGFYAKGGAKSVVVDERARDTFRDGLGSTVERIANQLRFVGKDYGGVAGFPAALSLAPAIARDIHATRPVYVDAVSRALPLAEAIPDRPTLDELYSPFVKELHGKRNWLTWATKFWHFLNVDAFPMEDSTVDRFFKLQNLAVSLDKYERLLPNYREFTSAHQDWVPRLRATDCGLAWSELKLWDKVCYGTAEINKRSERAR